MVSQQMCHFNRYDKGAELRVRSLSRREGITVRD